METLEGIARKICAWRGWEFLHLTPNGFAHTRPNNDGPTTYIWTEDSIAPTPDTITDRLCAEIKSRAERGIQKYGVTLDEAQLTTRQVLQHAKEEALDLAAYLERLIEIEERIAKAPRAWAVQNFDTKQMLCVHLGHHAEDSAESDRELAGSNCVATRVAIVELKEGE